MPLAYPTSLPTSDLRTIYEIVIGSKPFDAGTAAAAGWTVQGYLQSLLIPVSGQSMKLVAGGEVPADKESVLDLIRTLLGDKDAEAKVQAMDMVNRGEGLGGMIGDVLKERIAALLLPIIQDWIAQFLAGKMPA